MNFIELTKKYPFPEKRPRHHVAPYLYVPFSKLKVVPKNYPLPIETVDWKNIFLNGKKPDYLDIGSGRGKFLLEMAENNPQKNILGLEIRKNCVDWLTAVINGEKIMNAGILWYNVLNGLSFIEEQSLEAVFYLFPDPWPKSKHTKRRALNSDVLAEIYSKLKQKGKIFFATDLQEIHAFHLELLQNFGQMEYYEVNNDDEWNLPKTNKEISCLQRGKPYFRLIAIKHTIVDVT